VSWIREHSRDAVRWMSGSTPVIGVGLLLTAAMVFGQTASQGIDFHFFDLRLRVLDSGHHGSVFGVVSILAQAVAAGAFALRAASRQRLAGLFGALLVGLLTVPRALKAHESVFKHHDVAILAGPLTIVFVAVLVLTFRDAKRARSIVWTSLFLLVCSFALHAVGPQADGVIRPQIAEYTWTYQLTGMLKHGAELSGWMLLATGLLAGAWHPGSESPVQRVLAGLGRRPRRAASDLPAS
jgi:hypothetical protein